MKEHTKILFAPNLTWISICPKNSLRDLDDDFFFLYGKMNNEITQRSHERCHLLGTPPFLPQSHLGSIGHSILVVMGPKVNRWNKERKGCTNNFKNMLEAFVTKVHKNYLLKIAFPFHSSSFLFFSFFFFEFILHFSLFFFFFSLMRHQEVRGVS